MKLPVYKQGDNFFMKLAVFGGRLYNNRVCTGGSGCAPFF